ncbi:MAG: ComEC family competence protein [Candidatus Magasanikbacteria bacterium]|nr:ComEC family competence protein [Candidatus Magasanikbacteria bacterium]
MKEGIEKIVASKSKTFLAFCFCFLLGAGTASLFDWSISNIQYSISLYFYTSLFILIFIAILIWKKVFIRFCILCLGFCIFGVWRFAITIPNCTNPNNACFYNGRKVEFIGVVSADPDRQIDKARYTVSVTNVLPPPPAARPTPPRAGGDSSPPLLFKEGRGVVAGVSGKVLVTTRLYPAYNYGDTLKINCKLEAPSNQDGSTFRYDRYLARYGIWSVCSFPKNISLISGNAGGSMSPPFQGGVGLKAGGGLSSPANATNAVLSVAQASANHPYPSLVRRGFQQILHLKSAVGNQINRLWTEPESSFMAGLLYGSKSGLPKELMDNFSKTGVTHIIAVSGFNVTIIVVALMFILISLGLWRQQAYWVVVGFLFLFVIFTGATGSVVRAGVMGLLVLTAQQFGRLSRIGNVLVFTAAVMVFANPYMLVWDAGFQLSFLATLGLVYISPVLEQWSVNHPLTPSFARRGQPASDAFVFPLLAKEGTKGWLIVAWQLIREPLLQTLSAILATLPLILYQFGRLSLVAPLVNILILWIIPLLMLTGFLAIFFSFIFFPLGQLIAWVAHFGLQYVIILVEWFGKQPWSAAEFRLPWWGMILMYALIIYTIKQKHRAIESV